MIGLPGNNSSSSFFLLYPKKETLEKLINYDNKMTITCKTSSSNETFPLWEIAIVMIYW